MDSPDMLMLVDCQELAQDDWDEVKSLMMKLKLKWKWISGTDWEKGQ